MKSITLSITALLLCNILSARENLGIEGGKISDSQKMASGDCVPASSNIDLDINNVRARLLNGGDMWWDLINNAKYEIPKSGEGQPENPSSLFAGAIWIGGIDAQGQLKVAAATYRQSGNDFFPGPLDENGTVDAATCKLWDHHYEVEGTDIDNFIQEFITSGGTLPSASIAKGILNWPAYGNPYNPQVGFRNLAPFEDVDANGYYDPTGGDYPVIDQTCQNKTYADQMIWWVYNDQGNIHTETGATAIGMEVQTLAFAFKTNDEINDMTFYKYKLLNKATVPIDSCFMGQWVDPDLGCYTDDYIGCDLETGLGVVYNSGSEDAKSCVLNYGKQPPYLGVDYFKGPLDENGNELGMSSFLYYVNDFTQIGNPENASDYYGYLSGTWKDGTYFTEGGNAYGGSTPTKFVFPDDPSNTGGWSECAANDAPADKRFIQTSGPFRLEPGASNEITIGVVWVRPPVGTYPCPSLKLLKQADEKAQALFDNCFKLIDGPSAPDLSITELDKELILSMDNEVGSIGSTFNIERFKVTDPRIKAIGSPDSQFVFQGYKVYQLLNADVSTQDFANPRSSADPSKARLIFQCDIKDNVSKIVNYYYDGTLDVGNPELVPNVPVLEVEGANSGISHLIDVKTDAFASGDNGLVNNKTYYFTVVSYAYNYYEVIDTATNVKTVQTQPFLAGRKNIKTYAAIPHITSPEDGGLILNAQFGDGPQLKRLEGSGNGKLVTDLTDETISNILANGTDLHQTYLGGKGPVEITVFNPKVVPSGDFEFVMIDTIGYPPTLDTAHPLLNPVGTYWYLKNTTTGETVYSDTTIDMSFQQLIPDWGLSVFVAQTRNPGGTVEEQTANNNGFLEATIEYAEPQKAWLSGIHDDEGESVFNWIRSGTYNPDGTMYPDYVGKDDNQVYENVLSGTWAPYRLATDGGTSASQKTLAPVWANPLSHVTFNPLDSIISFDLVFTTDKSKWSKCIVVETQNETSLAEGNVKRFSLRAGTSRDVDGNPITGETGMSYFPGYAINPETGDRLNVFFSENSWLVGENGKDMWWNPTSDVVDPTFNSFLVGGMQYIYVTRRAYDGCADFRAKLLTGQDPDKQNVYRHVTWVSMSLLAPGFQFNSIADGFIPTETKIRVRVTKPYEVYKTDITTNNGQPHYSFNTADIAAVTNSNTTAVAALDTINIVPNPYYAYSSYEVSQADSRVKITNLPAKCTIDIYSLDGILVRKFTRDDPTITSVDWDLKNDAGVPIASGLYLIHVDAPGIGEKTMKWFGVMRPTDLTNY